MNRSSFWLYLVIFHKLIGGQRVVLGGRVTIRVAVIFSLIYLAAATLLCIKHPSNIKYMVVIRSVGQKNISVVFLNRIHTFLAFTQVIHTFKSLLFWS